MGYNWTKENMKKVTLVLVLLVTLFSVSGTAYASNTVTKTTRSLDVNSTSYVNAELRNDDYNQILCLYSDGTCVIRTENGRGSGTYDIDRARGRISIKWGNGTSQQGSAFFEDGQLKSVRIEGVTYSRRLVKNRR